jgi:hypothetical protein
MSAINPLRPEDSQGFDWDRSKNTPQINAFIDAVIDEAQGRGLDEATVFEQLTAPVHEPSAAERIAEHTGRNEWAKLDAIATFLKERGKPLTTAEQAFIVTLLKG